jgi:hypothetical protein
VLHSVDFFDPERDRRKPFIPGAMKVGERLLTVELFGG